MFQSLKNFRPVGGELYSTRNYGVLSEFNTQQIKVYRCSKPDFIEQEDLDDIQWKLGIKSVLDFRNHDNELKKGESRLLDDSADVHVVDIDAMDKNATSIKWKTTACDKKNQRIRHIMINFFGREFVRGLLFARLLSIWQIIWLLLLSLLIPLLGTKPIWSYSISIIDERGLLFLYKMIVDFCGVSIRTVLQILNNDENIPAVICCHAGKDRTGIIAALLLSICGCERKAIVYDYSKTEVAFPVTGSGLSEYSETLRGSPRYVMAQLLEYIDEKYGSVPKYLSSIGFSVEEQEELKERILL